MWLYYFNCLIPLIFLFLKKNDSEGPFVITSLGALQSTIFNTGTLAKSILALRCAPSLLFMLGRLLMKVQMLIPMLFLQNNEVFILQSFLSLLPHIITRSLKLSQQITKSNLSKWSNCRAKDCKLSTDCVFFFSHLYFAYSKFV